MPHLTDLHGGPLGDNRFCLDHFRFHWGADDTRGSEHSLAGKRYAAEVVFINTYTYMYQNCICQVIGRISSLSYKFSFHVLFTLKEMSCHACIPHFHKYPWHKCCFICIYTYSILYRITILMHVYSKRL